MLHRLVQIFLILPIAVLLVVFAVANRHWVTLSLDPFGGPDPAWSISMPLFLLFFAVLCAGVIIGGIATWMTQSKWRRRARLEHEEAARWRHRAGEVARHGEPSETRGIVPAIRRGS